MATHTPGPWKWDGGDYSDDEPFIYVDLPEDEAGPNAISVLFYADWGTDADARLIAAAPDLLRAARAMEGQLTHLRPGLDRDHPHRGIQREKVDNALRLAKAAIAKAEGGSR